MRFTIFIIILFSVLGLLFDSTFVEIKTTIPYLLSAIMFFMGITLTVTDFKRVVQKWRLILLGTSLQFLVMPVLALLISSVFGLSPALTVGMVLVGSCPGGTASNVIVFLGKGNVPLSISLTLVSTLISPILTPLFLNLLIGENVQFDALKVMVSIAQIVILPLVLGLLLNQFASKIAQTMARFSSPISSIGIALIIGCVLALNKKTLADFPLVVFVAIVLHNAFGFVGGYFGAKLFQSEENDAQTIAIEVGMQNSGLAVSLAQQFFSGLPLATLPGAIFSFWHNVAGVGFVYIKSNLFRIRLPKSH